MYSDLWVFRFWERRDELFHDLPVFAEIKIAEFYFTNAICCYIGKTQTSFLAVKLSICFKGMHKFEYMTKPPT